MVKKNSKSTPKSRPVHHKTSRKIVRKLRIFVEKTKTKVQKWRSQRFRPHKSFRRSYREDYARSTNTPGLISHAMITFKTIWKHRKTFGTFIAVMVVLYIVLVGLMSEDFYQQFQNTIDYSSSQIAGREIGNFAKAGLILLSTVTTGGLTSAMDEAAIIFVILLFLIMWLVTVYLLRHFLAGKHPKLRDGLYNALGPLLSTAVIFVVIFIQAIPLMLVLITYSAAITTGFLATPFYALVYFIFAALMLLLSGYLLSSSLIALVAVTAPGLYPMKALFAASDLMMGRRIKLVIRVFYLLLVVALIYVVTILPVILLDLWLKGIWDWLASWPIVPFCLLVVTCFIFIYATTYLYLYYRWLLDYKEQ